MSRTRNAATQELQAGGGTALDHGSISFLSRDGDINTYSNISMSSPEFIQLEAMPPPRSARHPQSSHNVAATQAMSEWSENPLEVLVQPQISDDLPSTKPSSGDRASSLANQSRGTQEAMEAAVQIAEDLLAQSRTDDRVINERDVTAYESLDELANMDSVANKSRASNRADRSSRKRTRETEDRDDSEPRKSSKLRASDAPDQKDLFAGLPKENYQPRKSRSRASRMDEDMFDKIDFSKRPEAKRKEKKSNLNRRKTTGGAVVMEVKDEDPFEVVEEETFTPAKSRSRKGKIVKDEPLADSTFDFKHDTSQNLSQSTGVKDAIVVAAVKATDQDDHGTEKSKDSSANTRTKQSKKKSGSKKDKQRKAESPSLQVISTDSKSSKDFAGQDIFATSTAPNKRTRSVETPSSHAANGRRVEIEDSEQSEDSTDAESESMDHLSPQFVLQPGKQVGALVKDKASKDLGSRKGKANKVTKPNSGMVEVVNLTSSTVSTCSKANFKDEDQASLHDEKQPDVDLGSTLNLTEQANEAEHPTPLADTTNVSYTPESTNANKSEERTTKHSPIRINRPLYRVGLSRRTRIEPLLKVVRKEKDAPKGPAGKKKT